MISRITFIFLLAVLIAKLEMTGVFAAETTNAAPFGVTAVSPDVAEDNVDPDPTRYLFYPDSPIHLGSGLSPNNVAASKGECVESQPYDIDHGALNTSFSKVLVSNADQLKQVLSIDAKIDAAYLAYGGGASYSYNTSNQFSSNSLTVVLVASATYGRKGIRIAPDPLTALGKKWINDPVKFAEFCGTRLVNVEYDASVTSVIITISNLSADEKSEVTAGLSGHGGWGPLTASASAKFDEKLAKSSSRGEVDIQVVATGGAGLSALATLLKGMASAGAITSTQAIENAMGDYLATFTSQNAAPVAYDVESMGLVGYKASNVNLWDQTQERSLRTIVRLWRDYASKSDTIGAVLTGSDSRRALLNEVEIAELPKLRSSYEAYMLVLSAAHKACLANASSLCQIPAEPDFPQNPIPALPPPPFGYMGISVSNPSGNIADPDIIWSPIQSKATLASVNPLHQGLTFSAQQSGPWERIENTIGVNSTLWFFVSGQGLLDTMQISFREDGTSEYTDLFKVENSCASLGRVSNSLQKLSSDYTTCTLIGGRKGIVFGVHELERQANELIANYLVSTEVPVIDKPPYCTDSRQRSGVFFLHIFDNIGREFFLPIFRAKWNINHYWVKPPGIGCYAAGDTYELDLIK